MSCLTNDLLQHFQKKTPVSQLKNIPDLLSDVNEDNIIERIVIKYSRNRASFSENPVFVQELWHTL